MKSRPARLWIATLGLYAAVFVVASALGSMTYFHFGNPRDTCASCHEMDGNHAAWSRSAHRTLHCRECHGGSLTLNAHALKAHTNRVVQHFTRDRMKPIGLSERDVLHTHASCRKCHPQSFADWESSRHSASYERIFLNSEHNKNEQPADDCLRCHGMFYRGTVETLLAPLNRTGPWKLRDSDQGPRPTIPCLACHLIHVSASENAAAKTHFYDCRDERHIPVTALPAPAMHDGEQAIPLTFDSRARLCTQCHAPSLALGHRPGTGDDRTPRGVHAGLSCLDCHAPHTNHARASCQSCHPARSHCGLAVEKMDTTFLSPTSLHDIHTVACRDCHPRGTPATLPTSTAPL